MEDAQRYKPIFPQLDFHFSRTYNKDMLIKRYLLDDVTGHLQKKEISLIVGPRQAGKTTLMKAVEAHLKKKGKDTLFLSLDFERDQPFFRSQESLVDRIRLEFGKHKGYVFIDEIQRKENAGLFLKGLYDMDLPYKFIVSGSGSMELKEKIHESLLGRKRLFELNTLSLREFINYRTGYRYEGKLSSFFRIDRQRAMTLFMEYMNFGGYPRVVLEETLEEKRAIIDEIFRTYIEKDISFLLRVEKVDAFRDMFRVLASQVGGMLNLNSVSEIIGVSVQTIKNYLSYAEKTFTIERVTPFFRNVRKEIGKTPVVYFHDIGLRNHSIGRFGQYNSTLDMGFLFQNLIFLLLRESPETKGASIHYWRTKDRAEVDFVLNMAGSIIPVECKCSEVKSPAITRSLNSFIKKYKPEEAWVINLGPKTGIKTENTTVRFRPFYELLE